MKYIVILIQKKIMNHNRRSTKNSKDRTIAWLKGEGNQMFKPPRSNH